MHNSIARGLIACHDPRPASARRPRVGTAADALIRTAAPR